MLLNKYNKNRLKVTALKKNFTEDTIFTGCARGESVFIPRMLLIPSDYPFEFQILQFPLKLCFAKSIIDKSPEQTSNFAGVDLRKNYFSRCRVVASWKSCSNCLIILAPAEKTSNILYKKVLIRN